jgi:hypothetical protein
MVVNKANKPRCQGCDNKLRRQADGKQKNKASPKDENLRLIHIANNSFTRHPIAIGNVVPF